MLNFYSIYFALLALVVVLEVFSRASPGFPATPAYKSLRNRFLLVHLLFKLGDWCQGPYFYSVYASKGFSGSAIGVLFLTGFVSSAILGTFVGALADKMGRVRGCQICGVLFAIACVTTHSSEFYVLCLGRLCGGVATSLLFSSFESWMVCQHGIDKLPAAARDHLFGLDMLGDGLSAMAAGFVAEYAKGRGGLSAPFDVSAAVMVLGAILASLLWKENYGDAKISGFGNFSAAFSVLARQRGTLSVGLASSLFEGAMFSFVFLWTSTLQEASTAEGLGDVPLGTVFSIFMAATMGGSRVFSLLLRVLSSSQLATFVMLLASACLIVPVFFHSFVFLLVAFIAFEFCVGIYFPAMGGLRARHIPENVRSTLMNIFRIPLNLFVVGLILYSDSLGKPTCFSIASGALAVAFVLLLTVPKEGSSSSSSSSSSAADKKTKKAK